MRWRGREGPIGKTVIVTEIGQLSWCFMRNAGCVRTNPEAAPGHECWDLRPETEFGDRACGVARLVVAGG